MDDFYLDSVMGSFFVALGIVLIIVFIIGFIGYLINSYSIYSLTNSVYNDDDEKWQAFIPVWQFSYLSKLIAQYSNNFTDLVLMSQIIAISTLICSFITIPYVAPLCFFIYRLLIIYNVYMLTVILSNENKANVWLVVLAGLGFEAFVLLYLSFKFKESKDMIISKRLTTPVDNSNKEIKLNVKEDSVGKENITFGSSVKNKSQNQGIKLNKRDDSVTSVGDSVKTVKIDGVEYDIKSTVKREENKESGIKLVKSEEEFVGDIDMTDNSDYNDFNEEVSEVDDTKGFENVIEESVTQETKSKKSSLKFIDFSSPSVDEDDNKDNLEE